MDITVFPSDARMQSYIVWSSNATDWIYFFFFFILVVIAAVYCTKKIKSNLGYLAVMVAVIILLSIASHSLLIDVEYASIT